MKAIRSESRRPGWSERRHEPTKTSTPAAWAGAIKGVGSANEWVIAATLQTRGQVERDLGNPARAMALLTEAQRPYRDISVLWGMVGCLDVLAFLTHAYGQLERAVRLSGAAAALREAVGLSCVPTNGLLFGHTLADARDTLGATRFARI